MRVLLISSNIARLPYPVYPLGLSMVAAATRKAGHSVATFDFLQSAESFEALIETIRKENPQVIGLSIRNIDNVNLLHEEQYLDKVSGIVDSARRVSDAFIIAGGSAFSILPEKILEATGCDYGIAGEGEAAFVQLLNEIACKNEPPRGTVIRSKRALSASQIPSADYDPALMKQYLNEGSIASIQTKRGCPLNCVYCSYPALEGTRIRMRDPAEVVHDMKKLKSEHGANYVFFTDSVFNDDQGLYLQVLREIQHQNMQMNWSAFLKPSGLTPEIIQLMKNTGLKAAELGTDAACDATLKGQRKCFSWTNVQDASNALMDAGISTAHYFMFGGPGETEATIVEGIENIRNLRCSAAFVFMGIRILPDTELYNLSLRQKVLDPQNDLLEPVYYISRQVDKDWMERTLTVAFEPMSHVLFPPDILDDKLQLLHKLGHAGALWDLIASGPK